MKNTLINVCGEAWSGTTLLDLMLGNAEDSFSLGEVYAWFRPFREHHSIFECSCGASPCRYWQQIKDLPASQFHKKAFKTLGVNFLIDSSKDLNWIIDNNHWANHNGIRVFNLLLWKQPISLAYSHWKRHSDYQDFERNFKGYYKKFFQANIPYRSISLDNLLANPSDYLNKICQTISMPNYPGKERFWEKEHHFLFGNRGVLNQVKKGDSSIAPQKEYPPEFLEDYKDFINKLDADKEILGLYKILNDTEISQPYQPEGRDPLKTSKSIKRPPWYYYFVLKRIIRRFIPEKYTHDID